MLVDLWIEKEDALARITGFLSALRCKNSGLKWREGAFMPVLAPLVGKAYKAVRSNLNDGSPKYDCLALQESELRKRVPQQQQVQSRKQHCN
jgi:hypothetical protein